MHIYGKNIEKETLFLTKEWNLNIYLFVFATDAIEPVLDDVNAFWGTGESLTTSENVLPVYYWYLSIHIFSYFCKYLLSYRFSYNFLVCFIFHLFSFLPFSFLFFIPFFFLFLFFFFFFFFPCSLLAPHSLLVKKKKIVFERRTKQKTPGIFSEILSLNNNNYCLKSQRAS